MSLLFEIEHNMGDNSWFQQIQLDFLKVYQSEPVIWDPFFHSFFLKININELIIAMTTHGYSNSYIDVVCHI